MKKVKNVNWGFIGCGSVTEVKSGPAFKLVDSFKVHGVYRRNHELAIDYAKRHSIQIAYSSAEELIYDKDIDAVYIATPPDSHKEFALAVADAGKICVIEKPMALDHSECVEISNAFDKKNIPVFVSYYRRSLPRFQKVKECISAGIIGDIRHLSWLFSKPANDLDISKKYNWRTDVKIAKCGYFEDLASHGLDLFTYFFGEVDQVNGITTNQQNLYDAKDAVVSSWKFKSGVTGIGCWNFGSFKREDIIKVKGSKGELTFSIFGDCPIEIETDNGIESHDIINPVHIQEYHISNIQKHLCGSLIHPSTGHTAAHTSWFMDQIVKS